MGPSTKHYNYTYISPPENRTIASSDLEYRIDKTLREGTDILWEQITWKSNTRNRVLIIEKKFLLILGAHPKTSIQYLMTSDIILK